MPDGSKEEEEKRHWPYFPLNVPWSEETNSFPLPLAGDVTQEEISASFSPRNVFLARWNRL